MSVGYRTLLDMSDVAASGSLAPPFIDAPANADTVEAIGALSPSRAGDFVTCPLLYRFRVIDQLPEPPSRAATRGTLVHAVLERLFDQPAPDRTVQAARALLAPEWERLLSEEPQLAQMFSGDAERDAWFGVTSTVSTSRRTAMSASSATRPAPHRGRSSRPARCFR